MTVRVSPRARLRIGGFVSVGVGLLMVWSSGAPIAVLMLVPSAIAGGIFAIVTSVPDERRRLIERWRAGRPLKWGWLNYGAIVLGLVIAAVLKPLGPAVQLGAAGNVLVAVGAALLTLGWSTWTKEIEDPRR